MGVPQLIAFGISILLSLISGYIQKKRAEKAKEEMQNQLSQLKNLSTGIKSNTRSTTEPLRLVYGTHRLGGNTVYLATQGTDNRFLYLVLGLGEGEIDSIYDDGNPVIWFDGERIHDKYAGYYEYELKTGTNTQTVATTISDDIAEFTDPMINTAYLAWKLTFNQDKFRSIPAIQAKVKGLKVYDFRNDTTGWSDNPVLALYDYMTNTRYGLDVDSTASIDIPTWTEAADYCDSKDFKINMVINVSAGSSWDPVEEMLKLFRGNLNYYNNVFFLRFRDLNEEASVMTLEDEHIIQGADGMAGLQVNQPGRYDRPTAVRVNYINAENDEYSQDAMLLGEEDGIVSDLSLFGCTDRVMAGKLGTSELERLQLDRTISGRFRDDAIILDSNDIVTFNSTALSIEDQVMRVVSLSYVQEAFVDLTLQYESTLLYDDVYNINAEDIYNTTLPDPQEIPYITNPNISEEIYFYRLRSFSRLKVTFTVEPSQIWFDHVEVWVSTDGDVEALYTHQFNTKESFDIDPAEEGTVYWIRLVVVNIWGAKTPFSSADKLSYLVTGRSSQLPPSPDALIAIANDNAINLYSNKLDNPDIEVYEFRLGPSWTGAIFLAALRSPNYSLKGVKPGSFTFILNTKSTNGLYGETPQSANAVVPLPKGWTAYTTFTDDYSGGTHDNTEAFIYDAEDYLKCSHTAGVLTGTYESPVFDVGGGAIDTYLMYVEAEVVVTGAGTTWNDQFPAPLTWTEGGVTRQWQQIFELPEAPRVAMTIRFKENLGDAWSEITRAELLSGVGLARYFQVVITITDPSDPINGIVQNFTLHLLN